MKNLINTRIAIINIASIILGFSMHAIAQDPDVILQRFNAESVKDNIYLGVDNGSIGYGLDADLSKDIILTSQLLEKKDVMFLGKKSHVKLLVRFYNPYQYTISVNSVMSEDPLNKSAREGFQALASFISLATTHSEMPLSMTGLIEKAKSDAETASPAAVTKSDDVKKFSNQAIIEWVMWMQTKNDCSATKDLTSIVGMMAASEVLFSHKFKVHENYVSFENHIQTITNGIYHETELTKFINALTDARKYHGELEKKLGDVTDTLNILSASYKSIIDEKKKECAALKLYTNMVISNYITESKSKIEKMSKTLSSLDDVIKLGEGFIEKYGLSGVGNVVKAVMFNKDLNIEDDSISTVTIKVVKNTLDAKSLTLKQDKEFSRSFKLVRYKRSWIDFTSGIFFSTVEYSEFKTGEGTTDANGVVNTPIIETKTKQYAMLAAFYNQVFDAGMQHMYPFFQLGVGTGKNLPTLLLGGGVRVINSDMKRLSISAGVALPFVKTLNKLSLDKPITGGQAQIDEDIRYRLKNPGLYVGFAWKL